MKTADKGDCMYDATKRRAHRKNLKKTREDAEG